MYSLKLDRYVMQDVLTTTLYYVHSYISESVRHLHVFNNNVAVPDVLETIFFQFKLIGLKLKIIWEAVSAKRVSSSRQGIESQK